MNCTCPEDWQGMDHTAGCKARAGGNRRIPIHPLWIAAETESKADMHGTVAQATASRTETPITR